MKSVAPYMLGIGIGIGFSTTIMLRATDMKTALALIGLFCVFSTATLVLLCVVSVLFRKRSFRIDTRRWLHNSLRGECSATPGTYRWTRTTCDYLMRTPSGWREFDMDSVLLFEGDAILRRDDVTVYETTTEEGITCES